MAKSKRDSERELETITAADVGHDPYVESLLAGGAEVGGPDTPQVAEPAEPSSEVPPLADSPPPEDPPATAYGPPIDEPLIEPAAPEPPVDARPLVAVSIDATIKPSTLLTLAMAVHDVVNVVFVADDTCPALWLEAVAYRWQHYPSLRLASTKQHDGAYRVMFEPELPKCQILDVPREEGGLIDVAALTSLLSDPKALGNSQSKG